MKQTPTYAEKMRQANREAKATVIGLALTVVVWIALGFGVATTGIEVFHTPLWIITGTVGTWLFAIVVAVFMSHRVIADVDLDDGPEQRASHEQSEVGQAESRGLHEAGDSRG